MPLGEHNLQIVVFICAMIPYSLESSDSIFNLGCAVAAVQLLPPSVSLKMSRNIYSPGAIAGKTRERVVLKQ